jgi:multidrug efflux pump
VLSISLSLIAVFIPILLMGGIVGRLFREFAVTLSLAIAVSLVVSLTTTAMMCARLLRPREQESHGRFYRASERLFQWSLNRYESSLGWVLRHQGLALLITILTMVASNVLYIKVPKGFFPQQDTGRINGSVQGDQNISFQALRGRLTQLAQTVMADPAVDAVMGFNGGGLGRPLNTGSVFVALKPLAQRDANADQVIGRLRGKLARIPGVTLYLQPVQDVRVGGRSANAQYQYTLQSENVQDLLIWGPRMLQKLRTLPDLLDVNSDQQNKGLQASLVIDRATAARLGISTQMIDNTLYDAFGQRQVSTIYTQLIQYHVVLEVEPQFWQSPEGLNHIFVKTPANSQIPLSAFTHYESSTAPLVVNHQGLFPAVTLSFNLRPGLALSDALEAVENAATEIGLPASIHGKFAGTAQAFQSSLASEPWLVAAALLTVYIVLGVLYESLIHPITILSTLPSAGVGALLALIIFRSDLSVIALIGIILLIGIVKKNAIMMIDFALEAERNENKNSVEAIRRACLLRFRPIMMTTMAALLGGLPLALGTGVGSELRRPLGITIIGGLIFSQMLTLYTTPVVYLYLDRARLALQRIRKRPSPVATHEPA